jgi:hypothetical protein
MNPFNCLSLPEALIRVLVVEWFGLKNVSRLDSALCCCEKRDQFALLAYGQITTFTVDFSLANNSSLLRWTISKGVRLDAVTIYEGIFSTEASLRVLETFFAMSGSVIRRVHSCTHSTTLSVTHHRALLLVATWCPNAVNF